MLTWVGITVVGFNLTSCPLESSQTTAGEAVHTIMTRTTVNTWVTVAFILIGTTFFVIVTIRTVTSKVVDHVNTSTTILTGFRTTLVNIGLASCTLNRNLKAIQSECLMNLSFP